MKYRKARNQITMITREDGNQLRETQEIIEEAMRFYQQSLRQTSSKMPATQQRIMKEGPVITRDQQLFLIKDFTKKDVLTALKNINDNKAPEEDGFNSHFFKKA